MAEYLPAALVAQKELGAIIGAAVVVVVVASFG